MNAADQHTEQALWLPCQGEQLLAVLHAGTADTGVVVVVGGPQYRAGSHRQFVLLARHLAAAGFPVLRFDVRGMGDSGGRFPGFEHCSEDVAAAIDALVRQQPKVRRVVLWGLCDGASAALLHLQGPARDTRVAGLCLLNPWVRSAQTLAQARVTHYYRQRLADPAFWRKLMSGGVSWRAPLEWLRARATARGSQAARPTAVLSFQQRMLQGWEGFAGQTLLVLSGRDLTAQEFEQAVAASPAWQQRMARPGVELRRFADADHTFSDLRQQDALFAATLGWLQSLTPGTPR